MLGGQVNISLEYLTPYRTGMDACSVGFAAQKSLLTT
jgi:hypothetical protein